MPHPDYIFDPDDWECTYDWTDRWEVTNDLDLEDPKRFSTLTKGPDKWAVKVAVSRDEDGDPDEVEVRWFDSEAEARAACGMPAYLTDG